MALFRSIATVGGYTMASRVLGFLRDVLVAAYLGAGPVADAFFVAFKFPNFFRRLFAEGAFNAAFVPMFAGKVAEAGKQAARAFAEDTMAVLLTVLLGLVVIIELAMPWFITVAAPGFVREPEKFRLAVELTRITFPYLLFISLVSLQGGVLNSLDRFAAVAATPVLLNLCLIGGLLGFRPFTATSGHALAWGVALAGVAQFVWLAWACANAGMKLALPRPRLSPEVKRLLMLMLPAALGSGVVQVNLLIDIVLASLLPTGAVSYLYYADRIYELPLAVIGIAIGTAILPLLARQVRRGEHGAAVATQNRALEAAVLLTLPAAAALIVLDRPIISVLFERGAFRVPEVHATAAALAAYAVGLPAYVLIKVLTPCFYAREDTRTPVKIAVICVVVNTVAALALMQIFAHVGIALATVVSAWLNSAMLAFMLRRRGYFAPDSQLKRRLPRVVAATLIMAVALWALMHALAPWLAGSGSTR
ncbi:MAG TPA: murein biosynthesis integral membrane protein MurJ, partial [Alphaproteobacteria bacterium]|nr:murein biosynthesis integral membrane protein MurJ [Alphaproteobacteria bacterium]